MRFVSFRDADGAEAFARVEDGLAHPLPDLAGVGPVAGAEALRDARSAPDGLPLEDLELLPVVTRPGKILCVGLNYRSRIEETGREPPTYPVLFPKFASNLIGHGQAIMVPPESQQVDYEAELAVVIGRAVGEDRRVDEAAARSRPRGPTRSPTTSRRGPVPPRRWPRWRWGRPRCTWAATSRRCPCRRW